MHIYCDFTVHVYRLHSACIEVLLYTYWDFTVHVSKFNCACIEYSLCKYQRFAVQVTRFHCIRVRIWIFLVPKKTLQGKRSEQFLCAHKYELCIFPPYSLCFLLQHFMKVSILETLNSARYRSIRARDNSSSTGAESGRCVSRNLVEIPKESRPCGISLKQQLQIITSKVVSLVM